VQIIVAGKLCQFFLWVTPRKLQYSLNTACLCKTGLFLRLRLLLAARPA
jgi:hypothetical protein